jgi:hypothetical protein
MKAAQNLYESIGSFHQLLVLMPERTGTICGAAINEALKW